MIRKRMFGGADRLLFEKTVKLRSRQTFAEELLWSYLRTKPLGFKFRRQHALSNYILDFYCHSLKLAIEVDGSIHETEEIKQKDKERQKQLKKQVLTFLRFSNNQVKLQPEEVIKQIEQHLQSKLRLL